MPRVLPTFILISSLPAPSATLAQNRGPAPVAQARNTESQTVQNHIISVSRSGEATAKPDGAQGALIIYTVKDPTQYEHQALQVAIGRARDAAQDIAVGTGVQLAGLRNVQSGYLGGNVVPRSGSSPLEGLKFRWFTTKRMNCRSSPTPP
jgi:uncharacterized protein YggE